MDACFPYDHNSPLKAMFHSQILVKALILEKYYAQ